MQNINRISPARLLSCAAIGHVVSVSPCFAEGNQEGQLVTASSETATPFTCDSLDPEVRLDIYQRRMERVPATIHDQGDGVIAAGRGLERCLSYDPRSDYRFGFGTLKKSDYCSSSATRI